MSENQQVTSLGSEAEIRIERMNTDKTRKDTASDSIYHVYFELSGQPPPEWRSIFEREWEALNVTQAASIDGAFLVLHCKLPEVATIQLPALKKAFAVTNEAYRRYVQKEATALEHREDKWRHEREDVDAVANSLHFE